MNNSHLISARYISPGNVTGARIALETWDLEQKKKVRKYFPWDHGVNFSDRVYCLLVNAGLEVEAYNSRDPEADHYITKWNFKALEELFGRSKS